MRTASGAFPKGHLASIREVCLPPAGSLARFLARLRHRHPATLTCSPHTTRPTHALPTLIPLPTCAQAFGAVAPLSFIQVVPDSLLAYIRFETAEGAQRALRVKGFGATSLLEGQEERDYWQKAAEAAEAMEAVEGSRAGEGVGGKPKGGGRGRGARGGGRGGGKGDEAGVAVGKGKGKAKGKGKGKGKGGGAGKGGSRIKELKGTVSF